MKFFSDAGIPENIGMEYVIKFIDHRYSVRHSFNDLKLKQVQKKVLNENFMLKTKA